jgi:peptidoglycan/LPS O-acetylase OafA/YrhL
MLPFYALGAAWLFSKAGRRGVQAEFGLIAALIGFSLLLYLIPDSPRHENWFRFSFLGHMDWLGLGLALAVGSVALERRERLPRPIALLAAQPGLSYGLAFAVYLIMVFALPPIPFPLTNDLGDYLAMHFGHAVMAVLIMVPVVFGSPNVGRSRRFLGHPVLVWLGLVSYGMYLWHFSIAYQLGVGDVGASFWPVLVLTLALSIPLGAVNWYLIERPMMRFKYGGFRRKPPKREPASGEAPS